MATVRQRAVPMLITGEDWVLLNTKLRLLTTRGEFGVVFRYTTSGIIVPFGILRLFKTDRPRDSGIKHWPKWKWILTVISIMMSSDRQDQI